MNTKRTFFMIFSFLCHGHASFSLTQKTLQSMSLKVKKGLHIRYHQYTYIDFFELCIFYVCFSRNGQVIVIHQVTLVT